MLSPGDQSYFPFSPELSTPPLTGDSGMSAPMPVPLKVSPSFRSVATVNTRQRNRSAALAALEGRWSGRPRRASLKRPRNFMSMSDDEDDELDEGVVEKQLLEVLSEEEDVVVPKVPRMTKKENASRRTSKRISTSPSSSTESKRSRRSSTIESLFSPLTNFIDLRSDDESSSRGWRSFVEFAA
jgi:hypothetical protein